MYNRNIVGNEIGKLLSNPEVYLDLNRTYSDRSIYKIFTKRSSLDL